MNRVAFDHLVASLEGRFGNREVALARNAIVWAVLGYSVLLTALVVSVSLVVLCGAWMIFKPSIVAFKIGIALGLTAGALALSILTSLWLRMRAPEGKELKREVAPGLLSMIDSIAREAGGVKFHKVLLVHELNAAVIQLPLAGIFGLHRNYLLVGLPLMDALSPEEFKAVLAHEFSHLSNRDGKMGNWIYRIRMSWDHTAQHLFQQEGLMTAPLRKFFLWFWPRFNARAFVLSRFNEYRADAFAASVTSASAISSALSRIEVGDRHLEELFWRKLNHRVNSEPEPPKNLYMEMKEFLAIQPERSVAVRWLDQAFAVATGTSNTHPSLHDRVEALGGDVKSRELSSPDARASETLLDARFTESARESFSREWYERALGNWKEAHKARAESSRQLDELSAAEGGEDVNKRWQRLSLLLDSKGMEYALPEIRGFAEEHPNHDEATFLLGRILLEKDDAGGVPLLERVAARVPDATFACLGLMADYFDRHGNHEAVSALKKRADAHDIVMEKLRQTNAQVSSSDNFLPHGSDEKTLAAVRSTLSGEDSVRNAWFMRRAHADFPELKQYVLVLDMSFKWYAGVSDQQIGAILQRVADDLTLDGGILVTRAQSSKPLFRRVRGMPDALVYRMNR